MDLILVLAIGAIVAVTGAINPKPKDTEEIKIIYLDDKDVIRHPLVKKVIEAYKSIEHEN